MSVRFSEEARQQAFIERRKNFKSILRKNFSHLILLLNLFIVHYIEVTYFVFFAFSELCC